MCFVNILFIFVVTIKLYFTVYFMKKSLTYRITKLLGDKFPLKVADIQAELKEKDKKAVTTQAIHNALNQLRDAGVVQKLGRTYQLNPQYILELDAEVNKLKHNYLFTAQSSFDVPVNGKREYRVETLSEQDKFWNEVITKKFEELKPGTYTYLQHVPHPWFTLVQMGDEVKIFDTILENATRCDTLSNGNTPLDAWLGKFYQGKNLRFGMREKSIPKERFHQYAVWDNFVLEAFYPKKIAARLAKLFLEGENLANLNVPELIALAPTKDDFVVTLHHNKKKAEKLRKEILKEF